MADGDAYREATKQIVDYAKEKRIDMVVGPEARGFIVGCPVAYELELDLHLYVKREVAS